MHAVNAFCRQQHAVISHSYLSGVLALPGVGQEVAGIAGPGGGSPAKPVGTVCFAWTGKDQRTLSETRQFDGDRAAVRAQAVEHALRGLITFVESEAA